LSVQSLSGKIAIVTGASAGIGYATAKALGDEGARVVVSARRGDRLAALAAELGGPDRCLPVESDASKPEAIDALMKAALGFGNGRVDIVVANAGHGLAGGVLSSDRSRWEEMYELNVIGAAHLMRRAAEIMIPNEAGDILALSSVAGMNVSPFSAFYGSTKFAVGAIAEGLRREICRHHVRVTVLRPAIVLSEFQAVAGYNEENFGASTKRYGQLLVPEDVARAIAFIVAQPPHVHINGLTIRPVGQDYP
jgi:NADP-dependent 3-hydroxy acid dehydrogenase YdfG